MYTGDGAHWLPELGTITRRWVETWGRHLIMGRQVTVNKWVWDFLKMIITALETLLLQHQQLVERKLFLEDGQLSLCCPLKMWLFSNSKCFEFSIEPVQCRVD